MPSYYNILIRDELNMQPTLKRQSEERGFSLIDIIIVISIIGIMAAIFCIFAM